MLTCAECYEPYLFHGSLGNLCRYCSQKLKPTGPAPKEEEMPIETLDMLDDEFDADQEMKGEIATERRAVARDAYMAALGGLASIDALADNGIVQHAEQVALETVRRWDAFMAAVDKLNGDVE